MNVMIIYDHPWCGNFCNSILQKVINGLREAGHDCDLLDLNKDGIDIKI